jgi:hypothetical protein
MREWLITYFAWLNTVMVLEYQYSVWFAIQESESDL